VPTEILETFATQRAYFTEMMEQRRR